MAHWLEGKTDNATEVDAKDEILEPDGPEIAWKLIAQCYYEKAAQLPDGVFYYLGTNGNTAKYRNPYDSFLVDATSSQLKGSSQISSFIGLEHPVTYCMTKSDENAHFTIYLRDKYVNPHHYALRNYNNGAKYWITGWNLEGSINGTDWTTLDEQRRNDELKGNGKICVFEIESDGDLGFNYFRIRIADKMNDQSSWCLGISGFELYGDLYDAYPIPDGFEQVHELKYDGIDSAAENGLFYLLGTNGFTEDYKNPYKRCLIDVVSSPLKGGCQISSFIGLQHDVDYAITKHRKNAFVDIDLKENYLIPTHYVLRNYKNGDHFWITAWNLEGSNDGESWTVLDEQRRNNQLRGTGTICSFELKGKHEAFSRFRIILKDVNNNQNAWELSLSGMEFYGFLVRST